MSWFLGSKALDRAFTAFFWASAVFIVAASASLILIGISAVVR